MGFTMLEARLTQVDHARKVGYVMIFDEELLVQLAEPKDGKWPEANDVIKIANPDDANPDAQAFWLQPAIY